MTTGVDRPAASALEREPATCWTQLDAELRMLCRGLGRPSGWSPEAVTTFVHLPGDAEYAQAMTTICCRLAREYDLEQTLLRESGRWRVRFARPGVAEPAPARRGVGLPGGSHYGLRATIAGLAAAMQRCSGVQGRRHAGGA